MGSRSITRQFHSCNSLSSTNIVPNSVTTTFEKKGVSTKQLVNGAQTTCFDVGNSTNRDVGVVLMTFGKWSFPTVLPLLTRTYYYLLSYFTIHQTPKFLTSSLLVSFHSSLFVIKPILNIFYKCYQLVQTCHQTNE